MSTDRRRSTGTLGNVSVRPSQPADVDAIVRIHVESTAEAYAPLAKTWPAVVSAVDMEKRRGQWLGWVREGQQPDAQRVEVVVELDGSVVGFSSAGRAREQAHGAEVELYVIHVLPRYRGAGAGALLWSEACRRVRGSELRSMYVSTLAELRCCSFYERHGGQLLSRSPRAFHGAERTEVIYFWPSGHSSECPPRVEPS